MHSAKIELAGLPNTRDLGGLRAKNGVIRPHRLIRSGLLGTASADALKYLTDVCRMHTIVDFRTDAELKEQPDPVIPGVRAIHNPILPALTSGISREEEGQTPIEQLTAEIRTTGITAEIYMANLYERVTREPYCQQQYAKFFDILLDSPDGATLWHCSAGKDRVGMGTALLEMALGVHRDDVVEDYLATQQNLQAIIDRDCAKVAELTGDENAVETVRALNGVRPAYILRSLDIMTEMCGSVENYMAEKIGLTAEKCARLQEMYIG